MLCRFFCSIGLSGAINRVELDIFNLRWVHKGSKFEEIDFDLLIEIFGQQIWDYDIIFGDEVEEPEPEIRVVDLDFKENLIKSEKLLILEALKLSGWVQYKAAEILKINVVALNKKISKYNITNPKWYKNV